MMSATQAGRLGDFFGSFMHFESVTHALKHLGVSAPRDVYSMPRNWVLLATAAVVQSHEFGTKLPANFINFYEPLYGKDPSVSLGPV